jgi:hypothetical protein
MFCNENDEILGKGSPKTSKEKYGKLFKESLVVCGPCVVNP